MTVPALTKRVMVQGCCTRRDDRTCANKARDGGGEEKRK
jgi:hypothetical protein